MQLFKLDEYSMNFNYFGIHVVDHYFPINFIEIKRFLFAIIIILVEHNIYENRLPLNAYTFISTMFNK